MKNEIFLYIFNVFDSKGLFIKYKNCGAFFNNRRVKKNGIQTIDSDTLAYRNTGIFLIFQCFGATVDVGSVRHPRHG
jgi:hypothetical protein